MQLFISSGRTQAKLPKQMRSFEDSMKSKKTVASMIERKGEEKKDTKKNGKIILYLIYFTFEI